MDCGAAVVDLNDVLEAIPGAKVIFLNNVGESNGVRKRMLLLPPHPVDCCVDTPDYYQIIKDLAGREDVQDDDFEYCETLDQGFCPRSGSEDYEQSPYKEEGKYLGITPQLFNMPPGSRDLNPEPVAYTPVVVDRRVKPQEAQDLSVFGMSSFESPELS